MAGTTREGAPIRVASLYRARGVAPPLARSGPRTAGNDFDARYGYLRSRLLKTGGTSCGQPGWRGRGRQGHAATETPKAVGLARAHTARAAGGRRWSGPLAGVRRRDAGGCASEREPGDLRPPQGADERQLDTSARLAPPIPASPLPYPWLALIRLAGVTTRTLRHQISGRENGPGPRRSSAPTEGDHYGGVAFRRRPAPFREDLPYVVGGAGLGGCETPRPRPGFPAPQPPAPRRRRGRHRRPRPGTRRRGALPHDQTNGAVDDFGGQLRSVLDGFLLQVPVSIIAFQANIPDIQRESLRIFPDIPSLFIAPMHSCITSRDFTTRIIYLE